MKIALCITHTGEKRMMLDLLRDYEVTVYDNNIYNHPKIEFKDEDVIISSFPYRELDIVDGSKPVIIYATNPFLDVKRLIELKTKPWVTLVKDAESGCYPPHLYPIDGYYMAISHAIDPQRLPEWVGDKEYILVANRKGTERWNFLAMGAKEPKRFLEDFLYAVPYIYPHYTSDEIFFDLMAHCRGIFYFSDNPYTLFMYEAMTMGIPMVAYDFFRGRPFVEDKNNPLHRYGLTCSVNSEAIAGQLRTLVKQKYPKVDYPITRFDEAKSLWEKVLNHAVYGK